MDIKGLKKSAVLSALFNASKQQGMGFADSRGAVNMTEEAASKIIAEGQHYFDYLRGRVMKIDIGGDEADTFGCDRDNGQGAADLP